MRFQMNIDILKIVILENDFISYMFIDMERGILLWIMQKLL